MKPCLLLVAALALGLSSSTPAQVDFTRTVTFGDSLTANDQLWTFFNLPRYRWGMNPMEGLFSRVRQRGSVLRSYAAVGATAPSVATQIQTYQQDVQNGITAPATLLQYEAGLNDVLLNLQTLAAHAPGTNAVADQIVASIVGNIGVQVAVLYATHANPHLVIWTIPDATLLPITYPLLSVTQVSNLRGHITGINTLLRSLDPVPGVLVLDVELLWTFMAWNASLMGVYQPPGAIVNYLFADPIHPSAFLNAVTSNYLASRISAEWSPLALPFAPSDLSQLLMLP